MTSRITVNNIESNSGVSSIALDSGVTIETGSGLNVSSGIVTASTISVGGSITASNKFYGDASQLTSISGPNITGTIPLAALGNVDLTGIKKDIALLSLQNAVDTNRVAYNLANSFIDQFENETGISAKTTVSWNGSGEYLSSKTVTSGSPIVYNYDGSDDDYQPSGISYFLVHMWGAAGGAGNNYSSSGGGGRIAFTGGPGGYTTGKITPTGSPLYKVSVGQGGGTTDPVNGLAGAAFNGGGQGRVHTHAGAGGGGGGYSGIFLSSKTHANAVMMAGGGAGSAGIAGGATPYYAGSGGGTTGQDGGQNGQAQHGGNTYGKGGSQTAGGAAGTGGDYSPSSGSALQGGNGGHMAGGGGGGYYGGGGGDHKNNYGSSGSGGGSSYIGHASVSEASTTYTTMTTHNPATVDPPGTGVSGYANNAGRGVQSADGKHGQVIIIPYTEAVSATGICTSKQNTVTGARTKVSGVMLYKDHAGTNTLGTDLKVFFTCNGGTNWTEVGASDFSSGSDFSTGIKTVYLAEKTCTSGTDVRYKIEFANQSGSKEARVHGMALNY